ncbi:MAG: leucine-rich repeat domain-containing protein, partial [Faecalispora jeddahensis]
MKKYKLLTLVIGFVLAVSAFSAPPVFAASSDFKITNGVLTKYTGTDTTVKIPSTVTEIGASAFSGNNRMTY